MSSLDTRIPPSYQSHADYQPVLRVHVHAQLERIVLTNMTNLSHSSVCLLASKCPKLNDIVLDGCDSVIEWYSPWMPSSVDSSSTFDNGIEDLSFQSTELKEVHQLRVSRHDILERAGESNKILNDS